MHKEKGISHQEIDSLFNSEILPKSSVMIIHMDSNHKFKITVVP